MRRADPAAAGWGSMTGLTGRGSGLVSETAMLARYLVAAVALAGATQAVEAQETPPLLGGTFLISIHNGSGGGNGGSLNSQALDSNPLLETPPIATLRCFGALDFGVPRTPPQENDTTVGGFLESGATSANCEVLSSAPGYEATTLSQGGYTISTVFDITFTERAIPDGLIRHDDGIGLYVDGTLITPGATGPTPAVNTPFDSRLESIPDSSLRDYRLIYVAANGNPSILRVWGTPAEPAPDFVDFGCRIDLAQTSVAPEFQFTLPASSSEKFCPGDTSNVIRLGCSGTIPGYSAEGTITDSAGVTCLVSGSQCGLAGVYEASVKSIEIDPSGNVTLSCEALPPG